MLAASRPEGRLPGRSSAKTGLPEPASEPHRVCRRLQLLRGWSYDKENIGKIFT
jgi:hypothetical protein